MAGEEYELQPPANGGLDDSTASPQDPDVILEGEEPIGFHIHPPARKKSLVKEKAKVVSDLIKK